MKSTILFYKKIIAIFLVILLTATIASELSSSIKLAKAEELGQIKIKEGFELNFPPEGNAYNQADTDVAH